MWFKQASVAVLFTLAEAYTHILALGRPGAGKTSYLDPVQRQLINQGAYCLHCCVKPDEADRAERLMRSCGKKPIRFSPHSGHVFNPLTYEMSRPGGSARSLSLFHEEEGEVLTRSTSERTESYWKSTTGDLLMGAFDLVYCVKGKQATYGHVYDVIHSIPFNTEHAASDGFRATPCGQFLEAGLTKDPALVKPIADLFLGRIPNMGEKGRGAVVQGALTSILPFTIPPLCNAVNGVSNITPEDMLGGYTILDFDTLTYGLNGLALQLSVSWFCMEECLRRKTWKRPFMLFRDEYHQLAHARRDVQVMSVGRSQGFIGVSAFQTIPVLEGALGGGVPQEKLTVNRC